MDNAHIYFTQQDLAYLIAGLTFMELECSSVEPLDAEVYVLMQRYGIDFDLDTIITLRERIVQSMEVTE